MHIPEILLEEKGRLELLSTFFFMFWKVRYISKQKEKDVGFP